MYGHFGEGKKREEDICQRLNSVFQNLQDENRARLNLENFTPEDFKRRKKALLDFNREYSGE